MKTQIIQLEPHDNLTSAQEKISWGNAGRLLLVWPEGEPIFQRRFDLVAIRRKAKSENKQLGIVSYDPLVQMQARRLGLPVFRSVRAAQRSRWREIQQDDIVDRAVSTRKPRPVKPSKPANLNDLGKRFFAAVSIFMIGAGLMAFLPNADIQLIGARRPQTIEMPITAAISPVGSDIQAQTRAAEVETTRTTQATGTTQQAVDVASGRLRIENLTTESLSIPKGTVVRPRGQADQRYETIQEVRLPGKAGAAVEVPIQALTPGESQNIPAGAVDAVEGLLGLKISVRNPSNITGGSDRISTVVSEKDLVGLKTAVYEQLEAQAWEKILADLRPGDQAIRSTLKLENVTLEEGSAELGEAVEEVSLHVKAVYSVTVIPGQEIARIAAQALDKQLTDGYQLLNSDVDIQNLTAPVYTQGKSYQWKIRAERQIVLIEPDAIRWEVTGMQVERASQRIQTEYGLDQAPVIRRTPGWWPVLPWLASRIQITVEGD